MTWRLSWGGASWTAEDLTGRHLSLIVAGLGADTWAFEPTSGPVHLIAVLAAFLAVAAAVPYAACVELLHRAKASELVDALTYERG